jgi:hypothetical protein
MAAIDDVKFRRARALAIKEELEIQRLQRELVPTAYVRVWSTRLLAYSRDALFKVSELREVLAVETDPVKCNQILRGWVERTLANAQMEHLWGGDIEDDGTVI